MRNDYRYVAERIQEPLKVLLAERGIITFNEKLVKIKDKVGIQVLRWSGIALFFVAAAVSFTWPLAVGLGDGIPLGTEGVATVPLFNLWTLAWNVESASHGFSGYWQAPIFYPAEDSLAFSEPQPVLGLVALVICSLGGSILEAYNLVLIACLTLNGLLGSFLFRVVGLGWPAALAGGALVLSLPFTHQELGVLQLVPLAGVLIFAVAVLRFADSPGLGTGSALGFGLALAYGLSSQIAVFAAVVALPAAGWLWWPIRSRRSAWKGLTAGIGLFFVLTSPLMIAQSKGLEKEDFARSTKTMLKNSASPRDYLESPWPPLFKAPWVTTAERPSQSAYWPGTARVLLALGMLVALASVVVDRRLVIAALLVLAGSVCWSMAPQFSFGEVSFAEVLRQVPGVAQIRSFSRFALFAQLAITALAAGALQWLDSAVRKRFSRVGATGFVFALALLVVLDGRPVMGEIEPLPSLDVELPWLNWIEQNTEADEVLAFLPFPEGRSSAHYLGTSQFMYWQMRHWRPMVNGYSGFFPASFKAVKAKIKEFPSPEALQALYDAGVRYCVVHRRVIESSPPPDPAAPIQLVHVFRDEQHGLAIFELQSNNI